MRTLVEAAQRAAQRGAGITFVDDQDRDRRFAWSEINQRARRRAAALRALGVGRGEPVLIVLDTSVEFVEVFLACQMAGAVPTPAYPPTAMARLAGYVSLLGGIAEATRASILVTDARIRRAIASVRLKGGLRKLIDVAALDAEPMDVGERGPAELGMIQCTSGSTSAPKPVALTHENLMANVQAMWDCHRHEPNDVLVSWLPLYHDLGLIGNLMTSIVGATELVLMSPATFLLDPAAWWRAIDRHRGTGTAAPCFAYGLSVRRVPQEEIEKLDLSCLRVVASGAEPIVPATIRSFFEHFAPSGIRPETFCASYGLAESCVGVSSVRSGRGLVIDRIAREPLEARDRPLALPAAPCDDSVDVVNLGLPMPGCNVVVRGDGGELLAEREVGEICVSGDSIMRGYLHDADATAAVIRDGELRTGDLGYLADGEIHLVGRIKHMLIVRGKNYYAEAIEAVVEAVEGVRKGNAVAFGVYDERRETDVLWIACETRERDQKELEERIHRAVTEHVGLRPARIYLLKPNRIPKTSSGKKQRHQCREMLVSASRPMLAGETWQKVSGALSWLKSQIAVAEERLSKAG